MIATYHNHSRWSDGKATVAELVEAARRLGVDELGISDHLVLRPTGERVSWSMPPERLDEYVADVLGHAGGDGTTVRLGVEVDWFDDAEARIGRALRGHPFDVIIGSVHELDGFVIDGSPEPWRKLDAAGRDEVHRRYWPAIGRLARSGLFDVVAHIDLCKKFGFDASCDLTDEVEAALDAVAEGDLVVELNTAGWHKPCADAYPTLDILRGCRERGIAVTLSADAHLPDHLTRDFVRGAARLAAAGYTEVARFAGRKRRMEPLAEALGTA